MFSVDATAENYQGRNRKKQEKSQTLLPKGIMKELEETKEVSTKVVHVNVHLHCIVQHTRPTGHIDVLNDVVTLEPASRTGTTGIYYYLSISPDATLSGTVHKLIEMSSSHARSPKSDYGEGHGGAGK